MGRTIRWPLLGEGLGRLLTSEAKEEQGSPPWVEDGVEHSHDNNPLKNTDPGPQARYFLGFVIGTLKCWGG